MAGIAFFVELSIDPAQRGAFDELMMQHAKGTLAEEQGCLAFDVYVDRTDPNRYALYELYADRAALDVHRTSARLGSHRREIDPLILTRRIWTVGEEVDASHFSGEQA